MAGKPISCQCGLDQRHFQCEELISVYLAYMECSAINAQNKPKTHDNTPIPPSFHLSLWKSTRVHRVHMADSPVVLQQSPTIARSCPRIQLGCADASECACACACAYVFTHVRGGGMRLMFSRAPLQSPRFGRGVSEQRSREHFCRGKQTHFCLRELPNFRIRLREPK